MSNIFSWNFTALLELYFSLSFFLNTFSSSFFLFLRKSGAQQNSLLGYCCLCLCDERRPVLSIHKDVGVNY